MSKEEIDKTNNEKLIEDALRFLGEHKNEAKGEIVRDLFRSIDVTMMSISTRGNTGLENKEIKRLHGNKHLQYFPTSRYFHYVNTAMCATLITKGLFDDQNLAWGVAICALRHDHQPPFGHNGEEAQAKVSAQFLGGHRYHGLISAMDLLYRTKPLLIEAFKKGIERDIIIDEFCKRIRNIDGTLPSEDIKQLLMNRNTEKLPDGIKKDYDSFSQKIKMGLDPMITKRIKEEIKVKYKQMNRAVFAMVTAAACHNGERGKQIIIPRWKTERKFLDELDKALRTDGSDKEMHPLSIFDAIVLISDQISSVPFDIIDGLKAGMVNKIPDEYIEVISKIIYEYEGVVEYNGKTRQEIDKEANNEGASLGEIEQEVRAVLSVTLEQLNSEQVDSKQRNNMINRLNMLAKRIQQVFINNIIANSNKKSIEMEKGLRAYFNNLRLITAREYQRRTYTADIQATVFNTYLKLTEELVRRILDNNKEFYIPLNSLFRQRGEDGSEEFKSFVFESISKGETNELVKDFYRYVCELRGEEYDAKRKEVREKFADYYREKITNAINMINQGRENTNPIGSIDYWIYNFVLDNTMFLEKEGNNLDNTEDIINIVTQNLAPYIVFYNSGQNVRLNIPSYIRRFEVVDGKTEEIKGKEVHYTRDEQIAAKIVLDYLSGLSEIDFLNLALQLGCISMEEAKLLTTSYDPKADPFISHASVKSEAAYSISSGGMSL